MKTIKQWFETFEDAEIRKRALENTSKIMAAEKVDRIQTAIVSAFVYKDKKEGFEFWKAIENHKNPASVKFDEVKHLIK